MRVRPLRPSSAILRPAMSPRVPDAARLRSRLSARLATVRWRGVGAAAAWVAVLTVLTFPPSLAGPAPGPDAQWLLGLDLAARAHLHVGTDIIWPYGALGFLGEPMYFFASQWILVTAFLVVVHAAVFTCVAVLFRRWGTPPWAWLVAGVAFLLPQFFGGYADREGILLCGLLFVVAADGLHRDAWRGWLVAATLFAACIALVVTTALVVAGADVALFVVVALLARRPRAALAAPVLFGVLLALAWLASGQSISAIPAFLRSTYEILSWYPATLALQPSPSWLVAGAATAAATVFAAVVALVLGARRLALLFVFVTPAVLVMFRDAFVRFDLPRIHIYLSLLLVVAAAGFGAATTPGVADAWRQARRWGRGVAGLALVLTVLLVWGSMPGLPFGSVADSARGLAHMGRLAVDSADQARTAAAAKRFFASEIPLSPGPSRSCAPAPSSRCRGTSPPCMRTACAGTRNRSCSRPRRSARTSTPSTRSTSPAGPPGLRAPVDRDDRRPLQPVRPAGRLPHAPRTLRACRPADGNQLVLVPRATPADTSETTVSTTCGPFARRVDVPSVPGEAVFADVSVTESPLGRALSTLFAPAWVEVVLGLSDGSTALFRLAPGTASDGLYMSGYAPTAAALYDIFTGQPTPAVSSFTLSTLAPDDYGSTVCVRFWTQAVP